MREAISWLRDALGKAGDPEALQHYSFQNGMIQATNNEIVASYPFATGFVGMLPGKALEVAVAEAPHDVTLTDAGVLSGTKYRARLPQGDYPLLSPLPTLPETRPVDADFFVQAKALLPFVSEETSRYWMTGVIIKDGHMIATNGAILVATREPVAEGWPDCIIPENIIRFAAKRSEGLIGVHLSANQMFVEWNNGAWARSRMIEVEALPATLMDFVRQARDDSAEWRDIPPALFAASRQGVKIDGSVIIVSSGSIAVRSRTVSIQHDCEWTLAKARALNPSLVAPLEEHVKEVCFGETNFMLRGPVFCAIGCYMTINFSEGNESETSDDEPF